MKMTSAFAAAALFALPAIAHADALPTITVQFADLDLNSVEGRDALDKRIEEAARTACSIDNRDLAARRLEQQCRTSLHEAAIEAISTARN